ncbi:MAG TPA: hypothetical protein VHO90_18990 [Bacteroidales bacterium]|nr:hypothetical protein [Bacteroidales bacterium]
MKITMRIFLWGSLMLACFTSIEAQPTRHDTISVEISDKLELHMILHTRDSISSLVVKDLKELQGLLSESKKISDEGSWTITYKPYKSLTITETGNNTERIIWENKVKRHYQFRNQCNIVAKKYQLQVLYNDLKDLQSDSLIYKVKEVIDTTNKHQQRITLYYHYNYSGGKLENDFSNISGTTDMLFLKASVGANLIKNQVTTDFTGEIGLGFASGGYLRHNFYVAYNLYYEYDSNNSSILNGMKNIGYRYNLARNKTNANWLGVELGYMKSRKGTLFDKNTFKLAFNWSIGKYISVSPQIFFKGDFSKAYPAVRIGFGF